MKMNSDEKKNISEAIKNIVISLSILIGGIWAYHTFHARLEAENATAKLEKLTYELKQRPVVNIKMSSSVEELGDGGPWIVKVEVIIENNGNTDAKLILTKESFRIAKVEFKNGAILRYSEKIYAGETKIAPKSDQFGILGGEGLFLMPGHTKKVRTLFKLDKIGIYQFDFTANAGREINDQRESLGVETPFSIVSQTDYLVVGKKSNKLINRTENTSVNN